MQKLLRLIAGILNPRSITIEELRGDLPVFVKRAKEGECFIITMYGQPTHYLMNPTMYQILASLSNDKPPPAKGENK